MNREGFLNQRRGTIGGSEIADVMGIGDYACRRKLYFVKTDTTPDFDDTNKAAFRRGRRLEPVAASYYQEVTGRHIANVNHKISSTHPRCSVSADRVVFKSDQDRNPGYLEIKTVKSTFPIRKKGLYPAYLLQVQYGMAVLGWDWGAFAVYQPLEDELLHWDFEADTELGKKLLDSAQKWWETHIDQKLAPSPLPPESKPCEECPFRITCRKTDTDFITL